jgi:DNA-directed RNA polymerase
MLTQVEIEKRMRQRGIAKAQAMIVNAENSERAERNPYAQHIFRTYVEPLKVMIEAATGTKRAGPRQAHAALLLPLDSWTVAYMAVRATLNHLMGNPKPNSRTTAYAIGKVIHCELYLEQFNNMSPDLYHTLSEDLARRKSKDYEHRIAVFKAQARKEGMNFVEWPVGAREQVGGFLLDRLMAIGMVDMGDVPVGPGKRLPIPMTLSDDAQEAIAKIKHFFELTQPYVAPCVEPPMDWLAWNDGGFHTRDMRRVFPYCVKAPSASRARIREHDLSKVLGVINHLQAVPWKINTKVLAVIEELHRSRTVGEIIADVEEPPPARPAWLEGHEKGAAIPEVRQAEFIAWKRATADWHTARKLQRTKIIRFQSALAVAREYKEYPAIYFVYFADSRGRLYPLTYGVSPQGSDLQKGLLEFAHGDKLETQEQLDWFYINGANKWGYDKATLRERADWWKDKEDLLLAMADHPTDNLQWTECDNPLQFLAWCMEFSELRRSPSSFVTRIPIGMDGSCNGLQNFSAMLLDEVGGAATNLVPSPDMKDIYAMVAQRASQRMASAEGDMASLWLTHGISRSVCKRSVMTTPYGVTKRSAVKYVMEDYLKQGKAPEFPAAQHFQAAQFLMDYVWPSIGDVVVKAREAMDWLKKSGKAIAKSLPEEDEGVISWVTPSGFLATQAYYEINEQRIATKLYGHARILVLSEKDECSADRHGTAIAPNFVHSYDAAHLHLTVDRMRRDAPAAPLAMIHDDYGTTAKYAPILFKAIREEFVKMYDGHDALGNLRNRYPVCTEPPSKGNLDLHAVLNSDYFFS